MVALYCKSGRHRSVALAEMLTGVLARDGFNVSLAEHLSSWYWRWVACMRDQSCSQRTRDLTDEKISLYDRMKVDYWADDWE